MKRVDFSKYTNGDYKPGGVVKRVLWYVTVHLFFKTPLPFPNALKIFLLRLYGARAGKNIRIKPNVNIKYPWFLEMGDHVWIGEGVWIDNMGMVSIGNNVCISQSVYVSTSTHDYKKEGFDLIVSSLIIEDGVWIAAGAIVLGSAKIRSHSIISAGSVIASDTEPYCVYKGVPAQLVKKRIME